MTSNHITIINLVDDIKEQIPEGIYLQLCNELKKNKNDYDTIAINRPVDNNTQLRQENIKLRQEKIKEVDVSVFENLSDISDIDFDTDTDSDEERERIRLYGD